MNIIDNIRITTEIKNELNNRFGVMEDICLNNRLYTFDKASIWSPTLSYRSDEGCDEITRSSLLNKCSSSDFIKSNSVCRNGLSTILSFI